MRNDRSTDDGSPDAAASDRQPLLVAAQGNDDHADARAEPEIALADVLTADEACRFLRLDEGRDMVRAMRSLRFYVARRELRPFQVGRKLHYLREELLRFCRARTDEYAELAGY